MKKQFDVKRIVKFAFHLQAWDFLYFIRQPNGRWMGEYEGDTWDDSEYEFEVQYAALQTHADSEGGGE